MTAIVTTFKISFENIAVVKSFLDYHLFIGFDHIYLFYDDIEKPFENIRQALYHYKSSISIFSRTESLYDDQKARCSRFKDLESMLDEVQARQTINAEYASILARYIGVKWLLHIDMDEIFYTRELSVKEHFKYLDGLSITSMTYANHEAVPEKIEISDYFAEVTLFRRHYFYIPMSTSTTTEIDFWRNRRTHRQYFLVYDNGKSAVRVDLGPVFPINVHRWSLPPNASQASAKTALADPRNLDPESLFRMSNPAILHYVTCGVGWLSEKYEILGNFPDAWFAGRLPIAPSFHRDARDAAIADAKAAADTASTSDTTGTATGTGTTLAAKKSSRLSNLYMREVIWPQCCHDTVLDNSTAEEERAADVTGAADVTDAAGVAAADLCSCVNCEKLRKQLESGVLFRETSVREVILAARRTRLENKTGEEEKKKEEEMQFQTYDRQVETFNPMKDSSGLPSSTIGSASVVVKQQQQQLDGISEMDRLRIISQSALNFL